MNSTFFANNRQALAKKLSGGLVVLGAYTQQQRANDAAFLFEQEANFWYLTGIEHADWQVIVDGSGNEWLVAPKVEAAHQLFDGSLSTEQASQISGIKSVLSRDEGDDLLRRLAKKHPLVHTIDQPSYADQFGFSCNPAIAANKRRLERLFGSVRDCQKELAQLRAIKQPEEIDAITAAVQLTVKAFELVKKNLTGYKHEYEIEADFTHHFRRNGAQGHAYDPIVAAGANACTLHYHHNAARLKKPQLILMDVGARTQGYAADITRSYSFGAISKRQQAIHTAVQAAHHDIIELLEPGLLVEEYARQVDHRMKQALTEVGLLKDPKDDETYRRYFPHAISHGLGIDVHDSLGQPRLFEAGMVLTVEPGMYIPEDGIGVRIEDDILITKTGRKNLSAQLSTNW